MKIISLLMLSKSYCDLMRRAKSHESRQINIAVVVENLGITNVDSYIFLNIFFLKSCND